MKILKKLIIILILFFTCFSLCGFVNKSAIRLEGYIINYNFCNVPKPVIIEKQFIIKDLYIPKIVVNTNIYPDISYLDTGICYWRNAIIGHNNSKTGFYKLKLLNISDVLYYKNVKYILSEIMVVDETQVKIVTESQYPIILFTCHYIDNDTKRLVLFFK